mmetsp:Transcript_9565/g.31791  ORF Transcript_9565/g.31791 Transcript_9565/m.31791 type:complete len:226 (+) Transcript_9565:188-865(+)
MRLPAGAADLPAPQRLEPGGCEARALKEHKQRLRPVGGEELEVAVAGQIAHQARQAVLADPLRQPPQAERVVAAPLRVVIARALDAAPAADARWRARIPVRVSAAGGVAVPVSVRGAGARAAAERTAVRICLQWWGVRIRRRRHRPGGVRGEGRVRGRRVAPRRAAAVVVEVAARDLDGEGPHVRHLLVELQPLQPLAGVGGRRGRVEAHKAGDEAPSVAGREVA